MSVLLGSASNPPRGTSVSPAPPDPVFRVLIGPGVYVSVCSGESRQTHGIRGAPPTPLGLVEDLVEMRGRKPSAPTSQSHPSAAGFLCARCVSLSISSLVYFCLWLLPLTNELF